MKKPFISGIQQIGIGVADMHEAWSWYRKHLHVDVPIFEEKAEAKLMLPYTGGKPVMRHAVLAMNLNGGGGFEVWQPVSRKPAAAPFSILPGDLGINAVKIKSYDIAKSYNELVSEGAKLLSDLIEGPDGKLHFFFEDPYGNVFEMISFDHWFNKIRKTNGGVCGAVIGVSDMDKAIDFYKHILGYDRIEYRTEGQQKDLSGFDKEDQEFERVLLSRSVKEQGPFSGLLGSSVIELLKTKTREPRKIFKGRYWGDLGFIHICFDIVGMDEMRKKCSDFGHAFTVDSSDQFDMGEAAGHFSYIEDPDGTLVEFVETHKIPILKKLRWYLDLLKRDRAKKLPKMMLRALSLNRIKN